MIIRWIFWTYRSMALALWPGCCRFQPSCSEYLETSIREKGPFQGFYLGIRRLLHCHPWGGESV